MSVPTGRESDKFMLRLPDGMRDRIKVAAESNNRSMNAEIVATLEEKYPVIEIDVEQTRSWEWLAFIDAATTEEDRIERLRIINDDLRFSPRHSRLRVRAIEDGDQVGELQIVALPFRMDGDYGAVD